MKLGREKEACLRKEKQFMHKQHETTQHTHMHTQREVWHSGKLWHKRGLNGDQPTSQGLNLRFLCHHVSWETKYRWHLDDAQRLMLVDSGTALWRVMERQWWKEHRSVCFETQNLSYYRCNLGQCTSPSFFLASSCVTWKWSTIITPWL